MLSDGSKLKSKERLAPPWWCNSNGSFEISLFGSEDVEERVDMASMSMDASFILSRNMSIWDVNEAPSPAILVSFGGGFLATCAMLFPCLQKKKKTKSFVLTRATSE
mgnify:FL=1